MESIQPVDDNGWTASWRFPLVEDMNKQELLDHIEVSRARLEAVLSRIPQERISQAGAQGLWSVKDLLDHIVVWEQRMLDWLATTLEGRKPQMLPEGMTWDDLDRWNQETYEARRDRPLEKVLEDFETTFPRVLHTVSEIPEEDLVQPDRFAWRENSPLWKMVAANTYWHYDEHAQDLERWLKGISDADEL
jgi:hypothetical protein